MCIALPMQVLSVSPGHAVVVRRGEQRRVNTALVGALAPGDWVLVFLDSARTQIDAATAAEVDATLDLLEAAMSPCHGTDSAHGAHGDAAFELPSQRSTADLWALTGQPHPAPQTAVAAESESSAAGT
jgi:hydrogenase expression/formation protein HypC